MEINKILTSLRIRMRIDRRPKYLVDKCMKCGRVVYYMIYKYNRSIKYMPVDPGSMLPAEKNAIFILDAILKFNPAKGHRSHYLTCPKKPIYQINKFTHYIKGAKRNASISNANRFIASNSKHSNPKDCAQ